MKYGHIVDNSEIIDEVLVTYFKKPKSYTTEDMCEINTHGGNIVTRKILELCLKNGANLAEPGEFTKRAFLNGRIDLLQAESVIDVINAKSEREAKTGIKQLEGMLSKKINDKNIKKELESEKRYRKCHLKSAEIATSLPKSCILTGYVKRYNGKFLHSIVEIEKEDGKYIIDYTKNIIMPKEQYVKLTEFEELESISDLEYLEYIQRLENIPGLNGKVLLTFGREIFKELEKNSFLIKNDEELEKIIDNIKEYKLKERENNSKEIDNEERE